MNEAANELLVLTVSGMALGAVTFNAPPIPTPPATVKAPVDGEDETVPELIVTFPFTKFQFISNPAPAEAYQPNIFGLPVPVPNPDNMKLPEPEISDHVSPVCVAAL